MDYQTNYAEWGQTENSPAFVYLKDLIRKDTETEENFDFSVL